MYGWWPHLRYTTLYLKKIYINTVISTSIPRLDVVLQLLNIIQLTPTLYAGFIYSISETQQLWKTVPLTLTTSRGVTDLRYILHGDKI